MGLGKRLLYMLCVCVCVKPSKIRIHAHTREGRVPLLLGFSARRDGSVRARREVGAIDPELVTMVTLWTNHPLADSLRHRHALESVYSYIYIYYIYKYVYIYILVCVYTSTFAGHVRSSLSHCLLLHFIVHLLYSIIIISFIFISPPPSNKIK